MQFPQVVSTRHSQKERKWKCTSNYPSIQTSSYKSYEGTVKAMSEAAGTTKRNNAAVSHQALTPELVDLPWDNCHSTSRNNISMMNYQSLKWRWEIYLRPRVLISVTMRVPIIMNWLRCKGCHFVQMDDEKYAGVVQASPVHLMWNLSPCTMKLYNH